ncbi:CocE/NonD family hydrolase [Olivibacter sitiensis]|uniref:CocE/NonD family hydrolase n=1 Tax=Olivibacter sitiensis TaxID=376470 RepID=UPI00055CC5DA|nr:CocE/NonD family hydrolase [Olivibacter sitiensis]
MRTLLFKLPFIMCYFSFFSSLSIAQPALSGGIDTAYMRSRFNKIEQQITMRDGVKLFTSIYVPKNLDKKAPILLSRTPYSVAPYGTDKYKPFVGPSPLFSTGDYIVVYQDVRGRYMSEGDFVAVRPYKPNKKKKEIDETTDTYDTVDWLVKHIDGNNGKVGTWGISAPGFYATMTAIDAHPAVKAVSPQAPVTDWFMGDDRHHNGAFFLMGTFAFLSYYGAPRPEPTTESSRNTIPYGTPDGYDFYKKLGPLKNANERYFKGENAIWNQMMDNESYNEFWQERAVVPHLKDIKPAVLTVGGWFDQEDLYGPFKTFAGIEDNSPKSPNHLVVGPWIHGSWTRGLGNYLGNIVFEKETAPYYREQIEKRFFDQYLLEGEDAQLAKATIFETGSNQWKKYGAWPPQESVEKNIYLQANGKLSFDVPVEKDSFDEYESDPKNPVPYTSEIRILRGSDYMYEDQRFAARRPDVLVYESDPLEEDVTISGDVWANLFVATSGTDADYVVKLIDVYPDDAPNNSPINRNTQMGGFQLLIRGEVMRAKFRKSFSEPEAMVPNKVEEVGFDMQDAAHCFKKGHKIMVQVQSTWFPLVDINPQRFVNIYQADESDFQKASHRIFHDAQHPSHLKVRMVETN